MAGMKALATELGIDYAAPLAGFHAIRDGVRINRIRYPYPNTLGLTKLVRTSSGSVELRRI